MTATVIRLPVAMKRGRKVTKGPKAGVTVLYKRNYAEERSELDSRVERIAELLADRSVRHRLQMEEYEAWIDRSPTVERFPATRRYRTVAEVSDLKEGRSSDSSQDELANRIAARAKEIMAERGMTP